MFVEEEAGAGTAAGGRTVVEVTQEFDPKDHAFAMDDQLFVFKSVIGDLFIKHGPGGLQETVTVQLNPGGIYIVHTFLFLCLSNFCRHNDNVGLWKYAVGRGQNFAWKKHSNSEKHLFSC